MNKKIRVIILYAISMIITASIFVVFPIKTNAKSWTVSHIGSGKRKTYSKLNAKERKAYDYIMLRMMDMV